jgi:hypothetical protein
LALPNGSTIPANGHEQVFGIGNERGDRTGRRIDRAGGSLDNNLSQRLPLCKLSRNAAVDAGSRVPGDRSDVDAPAEAVAQELAQLAERGAKQAEACELRFQRSASSASGFLAIANLGSRAGSR